MKMINFLKLNKKYRNEGFTLLISIITTSILLLVSFVVINISLKQLIITYTGQASQQAFYAADSGIECAFFWDVKNPENPGVSAFATTSPGIIRCNSQTILTSSQTVPTNPSQSSRIGGGGSSQPNSIFYLTFSNGSCVIVTVIKDPSGQTTIKSRGYNTCDLSASRRFERGTELIY
ncbi:MAG: pilus assembly PilX N-terminal domain-containing protein [Candidatus Paceibacterota bacterium]